MTSKTFVLATQPTCTLELVLTTNILVILSCRQIAAAARLRSPTGQKPYGPTTPIMGILLFIRNISSTSLTSRGFHHLLEVAYQLFHGYLVFTTYTPGIRLVVSHPLTRRSLPLVRRVVCHFFDGHSTTHSKAKFPLLI